jgi:decaprenylphospho-beta-D-ribofuranose 2-oxidase
MKYTLQSLSGWGLCPVERCQVAGPDSLSSLQAAVANRNQPDVIARGLGRAYGDSALNRERGVLLQTRRDCILAFDARSGILECEAGVSLADVIGCFLPRGWFLPTTPGTKFVTVGGAIAADVHGKNHHVDGSFGRHVLDLKLLTAAGSVLHCSPGEHPDLFWATVGGMGLTGVIVSARVQLIPVETAYYNVTYRRTKNLDESLECFASTDRDFRYSVAWIDCLASGRTLGRSVVMLANHARPDELPSRAADDPLAVPSRRDKSAPFFFPSFVLNSQSVRAFNALYYATHSDRQQIVDYDAFFYPLDRVHHWNRIYGRRGFVQYQALFPLETSRRGLIELLERVAASRRASFLAVLKTCGAASPGMLSYLHPGHTLALDLANTGNLASLVHELDEVLLRHGGRLYLAKDAMMTPDVFRQMYPRLAEFRAVKDQVDPERRFSSSQARRVGIVDPPDAFLAEKAGRAAAPLESH